jgi:hypothetical protein
MTGTSFIYHKSYFSIDGNFSYFSRVALNDGEAQVKHNNGLLRESVRFDPGNQFLALLSVSLPKKR